MYPSIKKHSIFDLYLHGGHAPKWLLARMKKLGRVMVEIIINEFGPDELLNRLADPIWFQAFSYILGYDWDSSGTTTVLTGVLKSILSPEDGVVVVGGKGRKAKQTLKEIEEVAEHFSFSESYKNYLQRSSKLVAKVDNSLVQDQNQIYHHTMFISKSRKWIVIQQGMNPELKTARRYHWSSSNLKSFVIEPHKGIIGNKYLEIVLNLTSRDSIENQRTTVDLVNDDPVKLKKDIGKLQTLLSGNQTLDLFLSNEECFKIDKSITVKITLNPKRINWEALKTAYELSPKTYEELIEIRGLGPATIRALALVAELIYNAPASWKDPIRYTFAHGGKDGVPYPVNVKRMEEVADFFENMLDEIKLGSKEKKKLILRLSKLLK